MAKERFPFREEFEPVVNVGENLRLLPLDEAKGGRYVRVLYIEALPFLNHNFGAIPAGGIPAADWIALHMDDSELGQFRIVPLVNDLTIDNLTQPRAQPRWVTRNSNWQSLFEVADPQTNPLMEKYHLNEIFQFEDDGLWVTVMSVGGVPAGNVGVYGFRYVFETLDKKPTVYTPIPVRGYRTVVRE